MTPHKRSRSERSIAERVTLTLGSIRSDLNVTIIKPGEANGLQYSARLLEDHAMLFDGAPCFADHQSMLDWGRPGGRSIRDLLGVIADVHWNPQAHEIQGRLKLSTSADWAKQLVKEFGDRPDFFGLSADMYILRQRDKVTSIQRVNSVDIVIHPAAGGRFHEANQRKETIMSLTSTPPDTRNVQDPDGETAPVRVQTQNVDPPPPDPPPDGETPPLYRVRTDEDFTTLTRQLIRIENAAAALPPPLQAHARQIVQNGLLPLADVEAALDQLKIAWANSQAQHSIQGLGHSPTMKTGLDRISLAFDRLMGLPSDADQRSVARLSGIREMYDLLSGDYERMGNFHPDRVTLANATVTTMAEIVADTLNRVMLRAFEQRPQWWKPIATEEDFPSLRDTKWITVGGFSDLSTVAEGAAYTEKTWDDYKETWAFVKKGNYLGLTLEMIDRDDVAAVRALPRKLGLAANRTLSAAVSDVFTYNSGVGHPLSDALALFHTTHANLGTTALASAEWDVVVQAMYQQAEYHSAKVLGVRPRYCLVPIELELTALGIFTTDLALETEMNLRYIRRLSSNVITVPEWTDATDWAAACDPNDLEGLVIGYRFGRTPELFTSSDELMGSMFTNDEMRIKVRFVYAVGVGDYRALYKQNVA